MARGDMEFFARCAAGFEDVLAQELATLSLRRVRAQVGGVSFSGRKADAYACCLWSRIATRVQLVVARVDATDAQALYEGVRSISWEHQVREGATLAVSAHGTNDELRNTAFVALKVKGPSRSRTPSATVSGRCAAHGPTSMARTPTCR